MDIHKEKGTKIKNVKIYIFQQTVKIVKQHMVHPHVTFFFLGQNILPARS